MGAPDITSRGWLIAVLDQAGQRLTALQVAGATVLESSWQIGDVTVTATQHGDGITLTTVAADGTTPVAPMKMLAGWTTP